MVYFKITDGHDSHKFWVNPSAATFDSLREKVSSLFPTFSLDPGRALHLHYRDNDGEKITATTDNDFQNILSSIPEETVWRFHISDFCNCCSKIHTTLPPLHSFPFGVRHSKNQMQHMFFADPLQQYSDRPIEISTSKNSMSSIDCMSGTTHSRAESIERTSILAKNSPRYKNKSLPPMTSSLGKNGTTSSGKRVGTSQHRKKRKALRSKPTARYLTRAPSRKFYLNKATQTLCGKSSVVGSARSSSTKYCYDSNPKLSEFTSQKYHSSSFIATSSNNSPRSSINKHNSSLKEVNNSLKGFLCDIKSTSSSSKTRSNIRKASTKQLLGPTNETKDNMTQTTDMMESSHKFMRKRSMLASSSGERKQSTPVNSLPSILNPVSSLRKCDKTRQVHSTPVIPSSRQTLHLNKSSLSTQSRYLYSPKKRSSSYQSKNTTHHDSRKLLLLKNQSKEGQVTKESRIHSKDTTKALNENVATAVAPGMADKTDQIMEHSEGNKQSGCNESTMDNLNSKTSGSSHAQGDYNAELQKSRECLSKIKHAVSHNDFMPCSEDAGSWKPHEVIRLTDMFPGANIETIGQWKSRGVETQSGKGILVGPVGYYVSLNTSSDYKTGNCNNNTD